MDYDSDEENPLDEEDYYAFLNVPKDVSMLLKSEKFILFNNHIHGFCVTSKLFL